jgi:hypothetical protein
MSIETLGEAYRLGWRVRVRCIRGIVDAPVSLRKCEYKAELDMQTLVWAKGRGFPLGRLGSRLMCPQCGSNDVNVMFEQWLRSSQGRAKYPCPRPAPRAQSSFWTAPPFAARMWPDAVK